MPIPLPAAAYPDTVAVYPTTWSTDALGGAVPAETAPTTLACSVQAPPATRRLADDAAHAGTEGEQEYLLFCRADPGVPGPDARLVWTHHGGVALDPPVTLTPSGPARPPGGLSASWTVAATARG